MNKNKFGTVKEPLKSKSNAVKLVDGKVVDNLEEVKTMEKKNEDVIIEPKIESTGFMQMGKTCGIIFNEANYEDEVELQLGDYEIEVRDGRTYAVRKKLKYPTTYEECCEVLDFCGDYFLITNDADCVIYKKEVCGIFQEVNSLIRLLICKSAYWKIAGEQMGLGKPWEPRDAEDKYIIRRAGDTIVKGYNISCVLEFPTAEMRDIFYENFKDLIEQCKELL